MLKAESNAGGPVLVLYSVATDVGTANINPFTNIIVHNAVNTDPATVFGGPGVPLDTSLINSSSIAAAQARIKSLLSPLFTKYEIAAGNLINDPYIATPENKLDALLDVISITTNNGVLSIRNKLGFDTIASGNVIDISSLTLDMTKTPDITVLTDVKEITQALETYRTILNLGSDLTVSAIENMFIPAPNYEAGTGPSRAEDMARIVAEFGLGGGMNYNGKLKSIRVEELIEDLTDSYAYRGVSKVYWVTYLILHDNGMPLYKVVATFAKELSSEQWKFIGGPTEKRNTGITWGIAR